MKAFAHLFLAFAFFVLVVPSNAQRIDWKLDSLREVDGSVRSLSAQDRHGILASLDLKETDVRVQRMQSVSGPLFLVQGIGSVCGANNCVFWILDRNYKVLLQKVTQAFAFQTTTHNGLPDVVTSMHGSAFFSSLSYWRFNGRRYVRSACADIEYGDAEGNQYKKPHISQQRCGTQG